jgi:hypothetical protein
MENENKLSSLSIQDLVAFEKAISAVCRKYENIALMNNPTRDKTIVDKASNSLAYFNDKRDRILYEMEFRINNLFL